MIVENENPASASDSASASGFIQIKNCPRQLLFTSSDRGSLSILSISLFLLLVFSSFVIMNTSSAFIAKRELIQIAETAASRAGHNLNVNDYYSPSTVSTQKLDVAIDCNKAYESFSNEIRNSMLRATHISIAAWNCDGWALSASVSSQIKQLFSLPILGSQAPLVITAGVAVSNRRQ